MSPGPCLASTSLTRVQVTDLPKKPTMSCMLQTANRLRLSKRKNPRSIPIGQKIKPLPTPRRWMLPLFFYRMARPFIFGTTLKAMLGQSLHFLRNETSSELFTSGKTAKIWRCFQSSRITFVLEKFVLFAPISGTACPRWTLPCFSASVVSSRNFRRALARPTSRFSTSSASSRQDMPSVFLFSWTANRSPNKPLRRSRSCSRDIRATGSRRAQPHNTSRLPFVCSRR